MARKVFVDTSFFKAVLDPKDSFHQQASIIWRQLAEEKATLVTSNYVLDETFTLLKLRCGRQAVRKLRDDLAQSQTFQIVRVSIADEAKAWDWFLCDWADLSFTDCVSFAVVKRLGIKGVASFDAHFPRAGFTLEN